MTAPLVLKAAQAVASTTAPVPGWLLAQVLADRKARPTGRHERHLPLTGSPTDVRVMNATAVPLVFGLVVVVWPQPARAVALKPGLHCAPSRSRAMSSATVVSLRANAFCLFGAASEPEPVPKPASPSRSRLIRGCAGLADEAPRCNWRSTTPPPIELRVAMALIRGGSSCVGQHLGEVPGQHRRRRRRTAPDAIRPHRARAPDAAHAAQPVQPSCATWAKAPRGWSASNA